MKRVVQNIRTGEVQVVDVPVPQAGDRMVLVRTGASLVSSGTERMIAEFARENLLQKARSRPDLVRQTLEKARRDGVLTTVEAVRNRLDQPASLGYSCAGTVIGVGREVDEVVVGDRVACAGGGYAVHAEVVAVPRNLIAVVPENVDFESAAFTTLGAIGLQGMRLADVRLGEVVAVIGLGLLGQLAVQMLKAAGCLVVGFDIDAQRAELAGAQGADATTYDAAEFAALCQRLSAGRGADAVLITAGTKSNEPVELAGEIARPKGVVVAVGAVGLQIPRKLYYEKELDFRISRSYGPGRYDPSYEEQGLDYPFAYVRWTEGRNMQAFVQMLAEQKVHTKPLITHRFPIEKARRAYDLITGESGEPFLGVLITYPEHPDMARRVELRTARRAAHGEEEEIAGEEPHAAVGMLGAGNFALNTLLPAMRRVPGIRFEGICSASGVSARHAGKKFGFRYCTTDADALLRDEAINTAVIVTRHHQHSAQVLAALQAGKHVFCEKPLAINEAQLRDVVHALMSEQSAPEALDNERPLLFVGYNRRFAPLSGALHDFVRQSGEPLLLHYRINAGPIPLDHWVQDLAQGGGRIIGEVCHFVDFLIFLSQSLPVRVTARGLPNEGRYRDDNVALTLEFADGSLGVITYIASGDKSFPKERLEVFGGGAVAVLDDFRSLEMVRQGHRVVKRSRLRKDKGHRGEWQAFVSALESGGAWPIPFLELVATTLTTLRAVESLHVGKPIDVDVEGFIASARQPPGG
jgi:predicted dehydrogenase/threonine dehydrogenase-like Zn-dependent dehydrogenase